MIKVKGKTAWIRIYELIWFKDDFSVDISKFSNYEKWLGLYYLWKYIEAKNVFEDNIWDLPSSIMIRRCQDIIDEKIIVNNWIYEFKTK